MNTTQDDEKPAQAPPHEEYMAMMREANNPETKDRNLRDWFAGMALQGQLSSIETSAAMSKANVTGLEFARVCYEWADAMLAARKEQR